MSKYVYVGDQTINPKTGEPHGPNHEGRVTVKAGTESVTLVAGQPTEVPAALVGYFEKNTHFKLVDESKSAAAPADQAKESEKPAGKESAKK